MQFKRMTGYKNSFKIGIIETCKWKVNVHPKKTHLYKSVFKRNLKIDKELARNSLQRVGPLRLHSHHFYPILFQWDSNSEVEPGSAFWLPWSTSRCVCQSCVLAIWLSELHHSTVMLTFCCVNYVRLLYCTILSAFFAALGLAWTEKEN